MCQNKTPTQSFCDDFGKHMCISFNNSYTVAFYNELQKKVLYNPPPYLKSVASLPCEKWMFSCTTLHDSYSCRSVTDRLFTINIYRNVIFWIICLCQLMNNIKHSIHCIQHIRHQHAHMLCVVHATSSMDASMTRCWMLSQTHRHCHGCADMMSDDVIGIQKKQLSSNKSIKQKQLLVYHSKMKLSSDLSIILANINE